MLLFSKMFSYEGKGFPDENTFIKSYQRTRPLQYLVYSLSSKAYHMLIAFYLK